MILFGFVALDQVPSRHFFIVSASCETMRMGMGSIRSKLAVRPGGYNWLGVAGRCPRRFFDVRPTHSTVPHSIPNNPHSE